jgi:hypothetical protein
LLLFEETFTSFSKIKSQKEVTKQKESWFFLLILLGDRKIWIRIRIHSSDYWIRIRIQEAQKHVDPDPDMPNQDPQHWGILVFIKPPMHQ